jgi:hypothetical protein
LKKKKSAKTHVIHQPLHQPINFCHNLKKKTTEEEEEEKRQHYLLISLSISVLDKTFTYRIIDNSTLKTIST